METTRGIDYYFAIIAGTTAFLIITGGFIISFIRYQRRLLSQQAVMHKAELQMKEDLLVSNIKSVEEERRRIAKDIHDELGGIFSTLALSVNQFVPGNEKDSAMINNSCELINAGLRSVRRIAYAIIPEELELFGLQHALENYLQSVMISSGIQIECLYAIETVHLRNDTALSVYRVVQELVANTLKHANADAVKVSITLLQNTIQLCYEDNGKGFKEPAARQGNGLGLKNIESRVISMHGQVVMGKRAHNEGYRCVVTIPVNQNTCCI